MKKLEVKTREPHYADIMETWGATVMGLYVYMVAMIGITTFVADNSDSLVLCLVASAFMLGVTWLPGLLMMTLIDDHRERFASLKPVYAHSRSIFADGLRGLNRIRIDTVNGAALLFIGVLAGFTIIMSIVGVALDPTGIDVAIWSGGILAWFGALVVGLRLAYDAFREKRKMRWVF